MTILAHPQSHFETIRDVKKLAAEIEFSIHTAINPDTAGEIETLLKKLANKAQSKRQTLVGAKTVEKT